MNKITTVAEIGKADTGIEKRGLMSRLLNTRSFSASLGVLMLAAGLLATTHPALAAAKDKDHVQQAIQAQAGGVHGGGRNERKNRRTERDDLPTIAITAPGNNAVQIYPAPFAVTASATFPGKADGRNDQRRGVETQFFASGQQFAESERAPYQATFTPPKAGIYTLTAQLRFGEGKRTILSAPVTVIADVPPTVNLTAPADNSIVTTPANVTLTASAASQIGTIAKVDFYAASTSNGTTTNTLLGSATTGTGGAYSYTWNNAPVGKYTLTAVATDEWGVNSTSAPVTLTVRPGELQPYYIHTDQIDSPREITDTSGNVVWQWDNADPFGNNVPNENPSNQGQFTFPLRFAGQYYDVETGLAYNFHRDYDASLGRYVESDPIGLDGGVNTYTYVGGSPVAYVDRMGLCTIDVRFAKIGINWYHAYIVTTEPDGSQTYFRGGPSAGGPSGGSSGQLSSASGGSSSGSSGSNSSGASNSSNSSSPGSGRGGAGENNGPWGPIVTESGPYVPGTIDYESGTPPTMNILNNDEPCTCYNTKFSTTIQDINDANIPYNPFSTNSNATAREVLERNGFSPSDPPVWAPGWSTTLPR